MNIEPGTPPRPPPVEAYGAVALFGAHAATSKARIWLRVAAWVIGADLVTKLAANLLLPENSEVSFGTGVATFRLEFNPAMIGTQVDELLRRDPSGVVAYVALLPIFAGIALPLASASAPLWRRAVLLGAAFYLPLIAAHAVGTRGAAAASAVPFAYWRALQFGITSLLMLRLTRSRVVFVLLAALTSAGLSNLLNFLIDPRGVTDFVYVSALEGRLGTANLADLVLELTGWLATGWVCISVAVGVGCRAPVIRSTRLSRALLALNPLLRSTDTESIAQGPPPTG